jgi:hypothetical protein
MESFCVELNDNFINVDDSESLKRVKSNSYIENDNSNNIDYHLFLNNNQTESNNDSTDDEDHEFERLYTNSNTSLSEFILALFSVKNKHKLSSASIDDILKLFKHVLPLNNKVPNNSNAFEKYFNINNNSDNSEKGEYFSICNKCNYVKNKENNTTKNCNNCSFGRVKRI